MVKDDPPARKLLVDLLDQACQLEHCLLDSYLYAACSLKSMPQEFEQIGGVDNRRRAIWFERARAWKQAILGVAKEEMLHMHYVECLRRGLGESPSLSLPGRDPKTGHWRIPNWRARIGDAPVDDGKGVQVPVDPLTDQLIRRFVVFESTDSLQDNDPFGPAALEMFDQLFDFEQDLLFESMLFGVADDGRRAALKAQLEPLYAELLPVEPVTKLAVERFAAVPLPPLEELRFQSIADFYNLGVQPLYEQAFERGWVVNNNYLFNNELLEPGYAAAGFLPVGPVHRDKNFEKFSSGNIANPLRHFKNVEEIIREIVEEGEGAKHFERRAAALLAWYQEHGGKQGGGRVFLQALTRDGQSGAPTPGWLAEAQLLRMSHLYRFAMIMVGMDRERQLAERAGVEFRPARDPVPVIGDVGLQRIADELPARFNTCYLVLVAWLARIYEVQTWEVDTPRRLAIEMIASWPLMSMAIRPMLELASFFPCDRLRLFRLEPEGLPNLPITAQQLQRLYAAGERSAEINEQMDYLAVRVLADVAAWAASKIEVVQRAQLEPNAREMILARLSELSHLDEFKKQFPFRVAGGYSNRPPDVAFTNAAREPTRYEESPGSPKPALFDTTLALRLRFSGWGKVQLATDPDPTWDEVGCTGTHMLHAADGDRRFDRALVWQNSEPGRNIVRGPAPELPALGVDCTEVALMVAPGAATAGYVPLQVLSSQGAVQTSGVQNKVQVRGLHELISLDAGQIVPRPGRLAVELLPKQGVRPFLNGLNHLVWQDGEPIDPFIFHVRADLPAGAGGPLFQREIFNEDHALLQMSPLQRLNTSRGPVGFDGASNIPDWTLARLTETQRQLLRGPGYPMSWLSQRAGVLARELEQSLALAGPPSRDQVDAIVSFAERMRLVSVPRGTTVNWLRFLLHYGHTLSGKLDAGSDSNPVLKAIADRTGLALEIARIADRNASNARWFVQYTKGVMDTDSLSDLVFGELYIPVAIKAGGPIRTARSWHFPAEMHEVVAAYACRFENPFWSPGARVRPDKKVREMPLGNGKLLTEQLEGADPHGYRYTASGFEGVTSYAGRFEVGEPVEGKIELSWTVELASDDPAAIVRVLGIIGDAASAMTSAMTAHFTPRP